MRKSILGLSAFALVALATPAMAQEEAADDGLGITITGGAAVLSDYRFRGISQINEDVAVQGNVTVTHESGLYAGFWGSTNAGQGELDIIAGFSREIVPGLTGDIGVTYYVYPNRNLNGFTGFFSGANEQVEPYVSLSTTFGPASLKVGVAYDPKQSFFQDASGRNHDAIYAWSDASVMVPSTPIKLTGHVGYFASKQFRDIFTDGVSSRGNYFDFGLGASVSYKQLTFGAQFISTDVPTRFGRELGADNTVVFSIGAAF